MEKINFAELIGTGGPLTARTEFCTFQIGGYVFEVTEDENDGYRRSMDEVVILEEDAVMRPIAVVTIIDPGENFDSSDKTRYYYSFGGWALKDVKDGHIWLVFGTGNSDDYYPTFIFDWYPKTK